MRMDTHTHTHTHPHIHTHTQTHTLIDLKLRRLHQKKFTIPPKQS
jgi:hypothetical protein